MSRTTVSPAPSEMPTETLEVGSATIDVTGMPTRDRVLRVALTLFAQRGYEASSMREIAEALGVTKAALYYHFASKEAIVDALVAERAMLWAEIEAGIADRSHDEVLDVVADAILRHGPELIRLYMASGHLKEQMKARMGGPATVDKIISKLMRGRRSKEMMARGRLAIWMVWTSTITLDHLDVTDAERIGYAVSAAKDLVSASFASPQD